MIQLVSKFKKTKQNKKKTTKISQVRTRGGNWLRTECKFGCETIMFVKSFRAKYVAFFREPSPQTICVSFVMIWLVVTPNIYTKSFAMGNAKVSKLWRHIMLKRHERILQHSCACIMTSWHDWHVHFRRYWPYARESYWSPVNSPRKGPVTRSFDVFFFNVILNKLLNRSTLGSQSLDADVQRPFYSVATVAHLPYQKEVTFFDMGRGRRCPRWIQRRCISVSSDCDWGCWLVNKPWRSYDVALMV